MKLDETGPVAAVGRPAESGVGQFRWEVSTDVWWWSDGLYRLYGYEPRSVPPSLERFLEHKDPRDLARIDGVFRRCLAEGGPFSCYHRIRDAQRRSKTVVVVGNGERDPGGTRTVRMTGFMVDVTEVRRAETNAALEAAMEGRAGIEQVKGALMLVHHLDADAAFALLAGHSQVYNRKVSSIVASVLAAFAARPGTESVSRGDLDQMFWDATH